MNEKILEAIAMLEDRLKEIPIHIDINNITRVNVRHTALAEVLLKLKNIKD